MPHQPNPAAGAATRAPSPSLSPLPPHSYRALRAQRDALTGLTADPSQTAPVRAVQQTPLRAAAPKAAPVVQIDPQTAAANDQNLANRAHQLEAALRRPTAAEAQKFAEQKRVEPVLRPVPKPAPAPAAAPAATAAAPQKQPMHSIEQEMASLLGRPGKT